MRCQSCDYPLWNLTVRTCPECGAPFAPSSYEFAPGEVRFCCPHCDRAHEGTGARGHLDPAELECRGCGRAVRMDDMVVRSATASGSDGHLPWARPEGRDLIRRFVETAWTSMRRPGRVGLGVRRGAPLTSALVYALIVCVPVMTAGLLVPYAAGIDPYFPLIDYEEYLDVGVMIASGWLGSIGLIVVWGLAAHALLRLTGRCDLGADATVQCVAYGSACGWLGAIPALGLLVGWIWWSIAGAFMVRRAQGVSLRRAAFALMLPPILFVPAVVGAVVAPDVWELIVDTSDDYNWASYTAVDPPGKSDTQYLVYDLVSYAERNGAPPRHAIMLVFDGSVPFVSSATRTTIRDIPVGDETLDRFLNRSRLEQYMRLSVLMELWPQDVVAHRFGDFVFTYHGADLSRPDPDLWVAVLLPDPGASGRIFPNSTIWIGTADNSVTEIDFSDLPDTLKRQNEHRAGLGLPPLPDLTTVLHDVPARRRSEEVTE